MNYPLIRAFVGPFLAALGFAILFNASKRTLFLTGLTGGIGSLIYQIILEAGISNLYANFFGALALTICAEFFAKAFKTTATTFIAPALIPLVPGGTAYNMMVNFIDKKIITGLELLVSLFLVAGVLALGVVVGSTLAKVYRKQIRKYKQRKLKA